MKQLQVNFKYCFTLKATTNENDISVDFKEANSVKYFIKQTLLSAIKSKKFKSFFGIIIILFLSCKENTNNHKNETPVLNTKNYENEYKLKAYKIEKGWGYFIKKDNKKIITQTHIPSINGVIFFQSEIDAKKVGNLMLLKLNDGIFPPSINKRELDSLNIKY